MHTQSYKGIQGTLVKKYNFIYLMVLGEKVVSEETVINIVK